MSGFWNEPPAVTQFGSAAEALSTLEHAKRGENESRLRLNQVDYSDLYEQLLLGTSGLTVELALGYASFAQLCKILGLTPQLEFLRGLPAVAVKYILNHYNGDLPPHEAKLLVHRREDNLLGGIAHYYEVKRLWSAKGSNSLVSTERWLYCLMLLEQAGWKHCHDLLLQDDLLVTTMYYPVPFKLNIPEGELTLWRGFLVLHSEAGLQTTRILPIVRCSATQWLVVGDPESAKALEQDFAELLEGVVGMFGILTRYTSCNLLNLTTVLTAQATITIPDTTAAELLMKAGLSRSGSVEFIGHMSLLKVRLTGLNVILAQTSEELSQLNDDPLTVINRITKLGLTLWP